MEWYERIRARREERGLSQSALAKAVGVSQALINRIEKGEIKSTGSLHLLANILDLRFDDVADLVQSEAANLRAQMQDGRRKAKSGPIVIVSSSNSDVYPGDFYIRWEQSDEVSRHAKFENASGVYAFYIPNQFMAPELEYGDLVFMNPNLPVFPGVTILLHEAEKPRRDRKMLGLDPTRGRIRRLIGMTSTSWTCVAWAEGRPQEETLSKEEWLAERIVLKEYRM